MSFHNIIGLGYQINDCECADGHDTETLVNVDLNALFTMYICAIIAK